MWFNDIDDILICMQDVNDFGGFPVPDEDMAAIGARDDVFVLKSEVIDVFGGLNVNMARIGA
jgi:hypothetical protein